MPSLNIPQDLFDRLHTLAGAGVRFDPPVSKHCTHWSVLTGDEHFACTCQPERLRLFFDALSDVLEAVGDSKSNQVAATSPRPGPVAEASPAPKPGPPPAPKLVEEQVPTPAQIVTRPLKYTPPQFLRRARTRFLPAAEKWLADHGVNEEYVLEILDYPEEILPAEEWRTIYRRGGVDVVYAERDHMVLAVYPSERTPVETGLPRLPGQKEQRKLPVPTDVGEMIALMESHGMSVEHGGKHWKIKYPGKDTPLTMPYTPSDYRWAMNMITEVKMAFGIDLREPTEEEGAEGESEGAEEDL